MRDCMGTIFGFLLLLFITPMLPEQEQTEEKPIEEIVLDRRMNQAGHSHSRVETCIGFGMKCTEFVACGDSAKVIWDLEHKKLDRRDSLAIKNTNHKKPK